MMIKHTQDHLTSARRSQQGACLHRQLDKASRWHTRSTTETQSKVDMHTSKALCCSVAGLTKCTHEKQGLPADLRETRFS